MRRFLLACIPTICFVLGIEYLVHAYTGTWPNFWWSLIAYVFLGLGYGSRRFFDDA